MNVLEYLSNANGRRECSNKFMGSCKLGGRNTGLLVLLQILEENVYQYCFQYFPVLLHINNTGTIPPMYGYMNNVHTGQPPVYGSTNNVHNVHGQPLIYSNTNPGRQEQPQHQHFLWERPKIRPFQ